MSRLFLRFLTVLAAVSMMASCLKDSDDETSYTNDAAITQFTLGSMKRYTHSLTKAGNDTLLTTTVAGANYKMTIDHLQGRIYNVEVLPVGTDVKHVVCTVTAKGRGMLALQSATSDSLRWFSATDSIDFTTPRVFRVYAPDGSGHRDYTVQLNLSSDKNAVFTWQKAADLELADAANMRLVGTADSVSVELRDSIVGASTTERYMLTADGSLMASADGGITWTTEQLDDDAALLPAPGQADCVSWPYATADGTDYVLMVGTPRQDDAPYMRVWRKIAPHQGGGRWVSMPVDDSNHYPLPRQQHIALARYQGHVVAVGSDAVVRQSRDQGITWRTMGSNYALPQELTGRVVSMACDQQEGLWMLTSTGQLWRGSTLK